MKRIAIVLALVIGPVGTAFAQDPQEPPPPPPPAEPAPSVPMAAPAPAATPAADANACYFSKLEIHGTVDFYGDVNFNNPTTSAMVPGLNAYRAFDGAAEGGGLNLNLAKISVARAPEPFGFRLDIGFGNVFTNPGALGAADPSVATYPNQAAWSRNFEQAYVSYKAPVGKGLTIDAGKFVTHLGAEVIETRDNWNYTRGLLFALAIPYYHTGLRAAYQATDTLAVSLYWVNGWNTFIAQGSKMETGGFQANWTPNAQAQLILNYIGGRLALDSTVRHVFDLVGVYKPTDKFSAQLNFDFGYDSPPGGGSGKYEGIAVYGRYQVAPWFASGLRFEFLGDGDGVATGLAGGQNLWEITATLAEFTHTFGPANETLRLEYRHDQSSQSPFVGSTGTKQYQDTLTVGLVSYF